MSCHAVAPPALPRVPHLIDTCDARATPLSVGFPRSLAFRFYPRFLEHPLGFFCPFICFDSARGVDFDRAYLGAAKNFGMISMIWGKLDLFSIAAHSLSI